MLTLYPQKQDILIASLTALAITIHIVESSIPTIIPGIKPGLSNIVILICLFSFGFKAAVQVSLLRIFISSLLLGTFMSPTFILSLSGALCSLFVMGCLWFILGQRVSPIGIAIASSVAHMLGQFYIAWFLYVPHAQLFKMLPIFITISVILGLVSGILSLLFLKSKHLSLIKTRA